MSRHNYTQYSNAKRPHSNRNPEAEAEVKDPAITPVTPAEEIKMEFKPVEETVETVTLPKTVTGVVANCSKLNVRVAPRADADIVCVLNVTAAVEIDVEKSTADWFSVCTATGIEGYCMRKFVEARL